jgi:tetratricopeptide (TPR) repeat protein
MSLLIGAEPQPLQRRWNLLLRLFSLLYFVVAACLLAVPCVSLASAGQETSGRIPLAESEDGPLQIWKNKAKFYLVVAVDQTGADQSNLPFALVDGQQVVQALDGLGYRPLVKTSPLFRNPTRDQLVTALQDIRDLPEWSSVLVYYSGHGVAEPSKQDVWLQLGGQEHIKDHLGVALSEVINIPRGASYMGELYVIVDACFSGLGGLAGKLTLREFGSRTAVLTSNILQGTKSKPNIQFSYPITLPDNTQMSAFTHVLLQALGRDWFRADDNMDGILSIEEIKTYSRLRLKDVFLKEKHKQMEPQLVAVHDEERFIAYRRDHVKSLQTNARKALNLIALERRLILQASLQVGAPATEVSLPPEAQALASQIAAPEDPYALGIKAQAEGRLSDAARFLGKAEKKELELARKRQEEHHKSLSKIYLARARNEVYAAKYNAATAWYKKAFDLQPTKDPRILNEMGSAWLLAGEYGKAQPFLQDAVAIREKSIGAEDPQLMLSLNNLATLYFYQARFVDAERLFLRALQILEKVFGPDHPQIATVLNNLSVFYREEGNFRDAERLQLRALRIREASLGLNHTDVAVSLNTLAAIYDSQGRFAEAEPLFTRALKIEEDAHGPDHPSIAHVLNNFSELYRSQHKYDKADHLLRRALQIREKALAKDHPDIAITLNNLGKLCSELEKYDEAEVFLRRGLQIRKTAFGSDHPDVANSLVALAGMYRRENKLADAEPLYRQALGIYERRYGPNHSLVAATLNNLARLFHDQKDYPKAEALYQRAIAVEEAAVGSDHPDLGKGLLNLADLYREEKRYADAEPLYQRAYPILKARLGLHHSHTKLALSRYADILFFEGKYQALRALEPDLKMAFPEKFSPGKETP